MNIPKSIIFIEVDKNQRDFHQTSILWHRFGCVCVFVQCMHKYLCVYFSDCLVYSMMTIFVTLICPLRKNTIRFILPSNKPVNLNLVFIFGLSRTQKPAIELDARQCALMKKTTDRKFNQQQQAFFSMCVFGIYKNKWIFSVMYQLENWMARNRSGENNTKMKLIDEAKENLRYFDILLHYSTAINWNLSF